MPYDELFEKFCLGLLTDSEAEELNQMLRADSEVRDRFLSYTGIHVSMMLEFGPQPVAVDSIGNLAGVRSKLHWLVPLGLAAAIALVTGVSVLMNLAAKPATIATLGKVVETVGLAAGDPIWKVGARLSSGEFTLPAGTVAIKLDNGVGIVLEGPGKIRLDSVKRAFLEGGLACVNVPPNAIGFVLESPNANVLDLGTEFGMKVRPGGGTDVQVYSGRVITTPKAENAVPVDMLAGAALRISHEKVPEELNYVPERFVRHLLPADKSTTVLRMPYNRSRFAETGAGRMTRPPVIDGKLDEWLAMPDFRSACDPPYSETYHVSGMLGYDRDFLYVAAIVGDPSPLRNVISPGTEADQAWRGGAIQIRICADTSQTWPLAASNGSLDPLSNSNSINHLTLWQHSPTAMSYLHISKGMNFRGDLVNPPGFSGAHRKTSDTYTLEYAIPWSALDVTPPGPGDVMAFNWLVNWSDDSGRLWRGQLIEIRNPDQPPPILTLEQASSWGRLIFE